MIQKEKIALKNEGGCGKGWLNTELVEEFFMLLGLFSRGESLLAEDFLQKSYWTRADSDTHTQTYTHSFISIAGKRILLV